MTSETYNFSSSLQNSCRDKGPDTSFPTCYSAFAPNFANLHDSSRLTVDWLDVLTQSWPTFKPKAVGDDDLSDNVYLAAVDWVTDLSDLLDLNPHHIAGKFRPLCFGFCFWFYVFFRIFGLLSLTVFSKL